MATKDLTQRDILEDMREAPELYYPEHVEMCERLGVLSLSRRGWRLACLST